MLFLLLFFLIVILFFGIAVNHIILFALVLLAILAFFTLV